MFPYTGVELGAKYIIIKRVFPGFFFHFWVYGDIIYNDKCLWENFSKKETIDRETENNNSIWQMILMRSKITPYGNAIWRIQTLPMQSHIRFWAMDIYFELFKGTQTITKNASYTGNAVPTYMAKYGENLSSVTKEIALFIFLLILADKICATWLDSQRFWSKAITWTEGKFRIFRFDRQFITNLLVKRESNSLVSLERLTIDSTEYFLSWFCKLSVFFSNYNRTHLFLVLHEVFALWTTKLGHTRGPQHASYQLITG